MRISLMLFTLLMLAPGAATQAQQCDSSIVSLYSQDRFQINNNETIVDKATGLMWMRCSRNQAGAACAGVASTHGWGEALQFASALNDAGGFASYNNWRLPNIKELQSLLEISCTEPAVDLTIFPNTAVGDYWSASSILVDMIEPNAWFINFATGHVNFAADRSELKHVRLVRDVQ